MATLEVSLTPRQCRAARALLGWKQQDLRLASRVGQKTIADFETGARRAFPHTLYALKTALEKAGVIFLDPADSRGSGVALTLEKEAGLRASEQVGGEAPSGEGGAKALDAELLEYWHRRPDEWNRISEGGRRVQSEAIFGDPDTGSELFSGAI